ncbi:MAG: folate-binding protein YgfZ [Synoicihabitans sp.]
MSGEDTFEFLQGQFTQNLTGLKDGEVRYGFFLTQKGRVLGDAFVLPQSEESMLVVSWSMTAAALMERLDAYLIADDVELEDVTAGWEGWQAAGPEVVRWASEALDGNLRFWPEPAGIGGGSVRIIGTAEPSWPKAWSEASDEIFEQVRILSGVPRVSLDLGEGDFPQEAGQHGIGVSFNKGCYLGQEVMARLAATGRLRRELKAVEGDGSLPKATDSDLFQGERKVGELRSRCWRKDGGWAGLAMVKLTHFRPAEVFTLPNGDTARVSSPDP